MVGPPPQPWSDPEGTLAPGSPGALPSAEVSPTPATEAAPVLRARLPQPGELVAGYRVGRLLGRGGMGAVYLAQDPLGREVALKVQLGGRSERFHLEGQAIARLQHEGIVRVHAQGCDEQGRLYCVMGLVPGGSLDGYLSERAPLPLREAAELILQAAEAMAYAHAQQILHRDLKPANLLRTPEGRVVITDFGLARIVDQTQHLSMTGDLLGTPAYMSPEQARGQVGEIGPAADIYSLGATLYDLLCERPPFADMPAIQLLLSIANLEPEPPSAHRAEIDPGLDALVLRCLAKEPADRYPSMEALAADLRAYLAEGASGVSALASARARSRRTVLGVAALGLLAAAAPFAILELLARDEPASSGAASPLPEATPGEAEVRLTLRPDAPLEVPPGASATFRVGPDLGGVRLGLRGPAETEVRVVGGGHERRLRCEADWELPLLLVRKAQLRPLSDGDYELKVDPQAAGPVEVRLGTWDNETKAPLPRREAWCVPELEECFRGEEALARAREVLETFARRRKEFGSRRGQLLGSRLYQRLRDLARTDGLPPAKLLLAVLGGYVFLDQAPESSPQRVALELVSANPDCFAVRWYAAEAISETEPRAASLHFRRCRELKPELPGPREWLLTTLAQAGEIEEFEREARQLVAMCPYNWKAQLAFLIATQRGDAAEAERCCAMLTTLGSRRLRPALAVIEGALRGLARAGKHDAARALARAFLDAQPALEASESLGGKGTRPWNRLVVCRATLHCEGRAAARKLWSVRETAAPLIYARWQALRQDIEGE